MKKLFFIALSMAFATVSFAQDKDLIRLRGNIANGNGDVLYIAKESVSHISKNNIALQLRKGIHVNTDGSFDDTFKLEEGLYYLFNGVSSIEVYLKKGYDLTVNVDNNKFFESAVYTGVGSEENNYLVKHCLIDSEFEENNLHLFDLSEAEFKKVVSDKKADDLKRLHENKLNKNLVALYEKKINEQVKRLESGYEKTKYINGLKNTVPPSFVFTNKYGGNAKLEQFKGQYVYVTFWNNPVFSTFEKRPFLKNLVGQYRDKNIAFVFVSVDDIMWLGEWKNLVMATEIEGAHLFANDPSFKSSFMRYFKLDNLPSFIILDPDGRIVDAGATTPSDPAINSVLDSLLK